MNNATGIVDRNIREAIWHKTPPAACLPLPKDGDNADDDRGGGGDIEKRQRAKRNAQKSKYAEAERNLEKVWRPFLGTNSKSR